MQRTLERARDAVRDLQQRKSSDIVVLIREGTYSLTKTVEFSLENLLEELRAAKKITSAIHRPENHNPNA